MYVLFLHKLPAYVIFTNFLTLFKIFEPRVNRSRKVLKIWYIISNYVNKDGSSAILKETSLRFGMSFACYINFSQPRP